MTVKISSCRESNKAIPMPVDLLGKIEEQIEERLSDWPEDDWVEIKDDIGSFWDLNLWGFDDGQGFQNMVALYPIAVMADGEHVTNTSSPIEIFWSAE